MSPGNWEIDNTVGYSFQFDASTLKFTVKSDIVYEHSGSAYSGNIHFKLCVDDTNPQTCSNQFLLVYSNCAADQLSINTATFASPALEYEIRAP